MHRGGRARVRANSARLAGPSPGVSVRSGADGPGAAGRRWPERRHRAAMGLQRLLAAEPAGRRVRRVHVAVRRELAAANQPSGPGSPATRAVHGGAAGVEPDELLRHDLGAFGGGPRPPFAAHADKNGLLVARRPPRRWLRVRRAVPRDLRHGFAFRRGPAPWRGAPHPGGRRLLRHRPPYPRRRGAALGTGRRVEGPLGLPPGAVRLGCAERGAATSAG
mmetsp:Transcript_1864/g.5570  ORF Transcript_1864/g.5570 Transcript_1864/m.5570 type:complete len:220 (+) Transcript_1864:32-691(+)